MNTTSRAKGGPVRFSDGCPMVRCRWNEEKANLSPFCGRRGAVLFVALVAIAVASVVFASLLRLAVAERRRVQTEVWEVQAAWLAESGLERAAARLDADAAYQGETWHLSADQLGAAYEAVVKIHVDAIPDAPGRRRVRVEADYPDDPHQRGRHTKEVVVQVEP